MGLSTANARLASRRVSSSCLELSDEDREALGLLTRSCAPQTAAIKARYLAGPATNGRTPPLFPHVGGFPQVRMTLGLVLGKQRARMGMQARGLARVAVRCCGVVHAASCQRYACRVGRGHLSTRARRAHARVVAVLRRRARAGKRGQRVFLHHTAVVVSNLERSIAFYERHLGGRLEYVVRDNDDPRIAELLQLPAIRLSFAFIAFEYAHLELLEFSVPADGRRFDARANDFGTTHLSFQVEDVQAAYERLAADGVELTRPPAPSLPIVFCFDPDGNRIELIQRRTH